MTWSHSGPLGLGIVFNIEAPGDSWGVGEVVGPPLALVATFYFCQLSSTYKTCNVNLIRLFKF